MIKTKNLRTPAVEHSTKPETTQRRPGRQPLIQDLQSAPLISASSEERSLWDEQITFRIFLAAQRRLNRNDLEALHRFYEKTRGAMSQITESPETWRRLLNALDEAICEQARIIGMRIYLSNLTYPRICQWEDSPNGARLHEKLGTALGQNIRISRGEAKAPLDPHLKVVRRELIFEIKKLQNLLKSKFTQRSLPDAEKLLLAALDLIADPELQFVQLRANSQAIRFQSRRAKEEKQANPRLLDLITGKTSPAVFVDALLAWSTNRSEEALRQALTKL